MTRVYCKKKMRKQRRSREAPSFVNRYFHIPDRYGTISLVRQQEISTKRRIFTWNEKILAPVWGLFW